LTEGRGIYVHVPFCARKCFYCDFNSYSLDKSAVASYLAALEKEVQLYQAQIAREPGVVFDTLYIGGGTPTVLSGKDLARMIRRLLEAFPFKDGAEVTCEANPGSSNTEKFAAMREAGVNRLSLGVQTFDDALLLLLGRQHTGQEAVEAVEEARRAGFDNINLDLMFALPGQSLAQWEESVRQALSLRPSHLSCYSLIVEEGTPFGDAFRLGKLSLPGEDAEYEMFAWLIDALQAQGYEHYEISNFALPGRRSEHNQIYWRNGAWLGLGPGAHGYWNGKRYANVRLPSDYSERLDRGELPVASVHEVSVDEAMDDTMIFGLRLLEGVSRGDFYRRFGVELTKVYSRELDQLTDLGLLEVTPQRVRVTRQGLFLANQVFAAFLRG
jgi:putative oxygen-independent coproporphyrinogen III oxidase